jgi:hypothetical protein
MLAFDGASQNMTAKVGGELVPNPMHLHDCHQTSRPKYCSLGTLVG